MTEKQLAEMRKVQVRELSTDVREVNEEDRTIELSISSEEPYERWFGVEIMGHSEGEVDYSRLNEIGVLLFNHDVNMPIGPIKKAWIDPADRKLRIRASFDKDEKSDFVFQKVKSGTLKGASIRYVVDVYENVKEGATSTCGRFTGPCWIARKWTALEGSIVSVPADATVGVGRSMEEPELEAPAIEERKEGGVEVTEEEKKAIEMEAAKKAAEEAEKRAAESAAELARFCEEYGLKASEWIGKGLEAAKEAALKALKEKTAPVAVTEVKADEKDKFRAAALDGLCLRANLPVEKPAPGASDFRGASILDLARECVDRNGVRAGRYDKHALIRAAMGTDDFTYLLSGGINKSLMTGWQLAPSTYQVWTKKGNLPDFKSTRRIQVSEFAMLPEVKPQGEYTRAYLEDGGEAIGLVTYGSIFPITRQAMINDDLDALTGVPQKQGAAWRMTVNYWSYYELVNGTVGGAALYSSGNGNLTDTGSGGAPSVVQIGNGLELMTAQKDKAGNQVLNIRPAFLICPVALEVTARQLIGSVNDPSKSVPVPNPFAGGMTVVSDPLLDAAPAEWYLAAAPGLGNTIEVAFLDGNDAPRLEQRTGWDVDAIEFKVSGDAGVKVLDFRGLYKNKGA